MRSLEAPGSQPESRLRFASLRPVWAASEEAGGRSASTRASERAISSSGHRSSSVRVSVGSRSPGADFPRDVGNQIAKPSHSIPQCGTDAGHLRHAFFQALASTDVNKIATLSFRIRTSFVPQMCHSSGALRYSCDPRERQRAFSSDLKIKLVLSRSGCGLTRRVFCVTAG